MAVCLNCGAEHDPTKISCFTPEIWTESEESPKGSPKDMANTEFTTPKYCNRCYFNLESHLTSSADKEVMCSHCGNYAKIGTYRGKRSCNNCHQNVYGCHHNSLKLITTHYNPNDQYIVFACKRCPVDVFYAKETKIFHSDREPIIPWFTPIETMKQDNSICCNCGNTTALTRERSQYQSKFACIYCLMGDSELVSVDNKLIACPFCSNLSTVAEYGSPSNRHCPKCKKPIRGCTHKKILPSVKGSANCSVKGVNSSKGILQTNSSRGIKETGSVSGTFSGYDPCNKYMVYECQKCHIELYLEKTCARFGRSIVMEDSEPVSLIPLEEFVCKICNLTCSVGEGLYSNCCQVDHQGYGPPKIERCKFHRECLYQWKLNFKHRFREASAICPTCYSPIH
jgi:hypothetical protein